MRSVKAVGALFSLFWLAAAAPAAAQMRCGNALVHEGDSKVQVLLKCDEPLFVERRYECFPGGLGCGSVEQWTYDLGPRQMLRVLTFRHGRLVDIELVPRP